MTINEELQAFPLTWPAGWKTTAGHRRTRAQYKVSFDQARRELKRSLELLGAVEVILSTNLRLNRQGDPMGDKAENQLPEPGVAVYFRLAPGKPYQVMACDLWDRPKDNIRAVGMAVEALRQLERCGSSSIMERAFTGFLALPAPGAGQVERPWWEVLGVQRTVGLADLMSAWTTKRREAHPDKGGTAEAFQEVERAYKEGLAEVGP